MRLLDLTAVAGLALAITLTGCYEESGTGNTQRQASYDEVDPTDGTETDDALTDDALTDAEAQPYGNSSSTLGKAKDSATRTIGDLEARDRELQKQIDDENRPF